MPERDARLRGHDHPGADALLKALKVAARDRLEHADLSGRRRHCQRLHHGHRVVAHPGRARHNRIAHRRRDFVGTGRQDLGNEERVAAGRAVQLLSVDAVRLRQRRDRVARQACEIDALDALRACKLAKHDPKGMAVLEFVVAIGGHDERAEPVKPTAQQPEHVERGLVGPLQVLEHQHRRRRAFDIPRKRREHLVWEATAPHELVELATHGLGDVDERAEVARSEQRLARAPQDPGRRFEGVAEAAHDRGLANARLASEQHELSGAPGSDRGQRATEQLELGRPLEQLEPSCRRVDHWLVHGYVNSPQTLAPALNRPRIDVQITLVAGPGH